MGAGTVGDTVVGYARTDIIDNDAQIERGLNGCLRAAVFAYGMGRCYWVADVATVVLPVPVGSRGGVLSFAACGVLVA